MRTSLPTKGAYFPAPKSLRKITAVAIAEIVFGLPSSEDGVVKE